VTLENRSPAVVKEEEEEITFPLKMKEEVVARNHGAGTTTAPTSEEEFIKIHHF
jgi:hypothetical protein